MVHSLHDKGRHHYQLHRRDRSLARWPESHPVLMEAGDVLFFGGSLVHGSFPNTTTDRFRRALIGHYVSGEAEQVTAFLQPVLRLDGTKVTLKVTETGGPCGVWVEKDGQPVIEMSGIETPSTSQSE